MNRIYYFLLLFIFGCNSQIDAPDKVKKNTVDAANVAVARHLKISRFRNLLDTSDFLGNKSRNAYRTARVDSALSSNSKVNISKTEFDYYYLQDILDSIKTRMDTIFVIQSGGMSVDAKYHLWHRYGWKIFDDHEDYLEIRSFSYQDIVLSEYYCLIGFPSVGSLKKSYSRDYLLHELVMWHSPMYYSSELDLYFLELSISYGGNTGHHSVLYVMSEQLGVMQLVYGVGT